MVTIGPLGGWEPTPVTEPPVGSATPSGVSSCNRAPEQPWGVLQVDRRLTEAQIELLREYWTKGAGGRPLIGPVAVVLAKGQPMREPLTSADIASMFDPWLISCSCWRCSRGGRCASMAQAHADHTGAQDRAAKIAALTDEDRAWLRAHGWDGK